MWDEYRGRRAFFFLSWLVLFPGAVILAGVIQSATGWPYLVHVAVVGGLGLFLWAGYHMSGFPCPRCGNAFFRKPGENNPLASRCLHCDWPKWAVPAAPADPEGTA